MKFRVLQHAERGVGLRGIPLSPVRAGIDAPEQRLRGEFGAWAWIYQSRVRFEDGKMYLVRVLVAEEHMPPVVVTAYRTSKIENYWSAE